MHVIFRTILILLKARRRRAITPWETGVISLRALPTDIDILMHINNGQYFSLFDLGRYDLMARSGMWKGARARGWHPVVQAEQITFRRSITFMTKFEIHTRFIGMDDRCFYIEHRAVVDGEIYVRATIAGRLVGREGPVTNEQIADLMESLGHEMPEDFEVGEELQRWRRESALPSPRKPAPNVF